MGWGKDNVVSLCFSVKGKKKRKKKRRGKKEEKKKQQGKGKGKGPFNGVYGKRLRYFRGDNEVKLAVYSRALSCVIEQRSSSHYPSSITLVKHRHVRTLTLDNRRYPFFLKEIESVRFSIKGYIISK